MPVKIEIPDKDLEGFTNQAQNKLSNAIMEYSSDLIAEANRIEAGRNSNSSVPEVTGSIVDAAKHYLKYGLVKSKKEWYLMLCNIVTPIASMLAGFLFNEKIMENRISLVFFIIIVVVAITSTIISVIKE